LFARAILPFTVIKPVILKSILTYKYIVYFLFFYQTTAGQVKSSSFQLPEGDIAQVIMYGQSLSTGQQTPPSISTTNYKGNLMLGSQVWSNYGNDLDDQHLIFNPLFAHPILSSRKTNAALLADTGVNSNSQYNCESPTEGFVNSVKHYYDQLSKADTGVKFAATSCGVGGRSIEALSKNVPNGDGKWYAHFYKTLQKSKEAATRMNKRISCPAILWMQGEYNYTADRNQGWEPNTPATNDKNRYREYLSKMAADMRQDIATIYGQQKAPVFITYQCGAQYTRGAGLSIGMAQLELANARPDIIMAGPVYPVTDRGGHLCPNGSRWYGEMMAKVYYKTVLLGQKWIPLQPKKIVKGAGYIDIAYYVPVPPLIQDTLTLQKTAQYGFTVQQQGADVSITSVTITSPTTVRLQVPGYRMNDTVHITYAGPATHGHGNICDSDDFISFANYTNLEAEGITEAEKSRFKPKYEPVDASGRIIYDQHYPMQNFSCAFYYVIPGDKKQISCPVGKQ
jgi:hypothetical protein